MSEYKVAVINGKKVKLYYIGVLAKKLQRTTTTLHIWENKGIIPKTWFRDTFGKRLYTMEQIDAILKSAETNKIMQGKALNSANFSQDCHNAFNDLHKKYFGGNDNEHY